MHTEHHHPQASFRTVMLRVGSIFATTTATQLPRIQLTAPEKQLKKYEIRYEQVNLHQKTNQLALQLATYSQMLLWV